MHILYPSNIELTTMLLDGIDYTTANIFPNLYWRGNYHPEENSGDGKYNCNAINSSDGFDKFDTAFGLK
ncbi:MAG: hypothetical protein IJ848_01500 [Alphaproteobacteria bacterium]|nr:hypothetical protein [Alphaproteobacteria bacterium]